MKATYIDLVNRFWAENRRSPFPPCQCALYFFLLNEANTLRWEMPFAVPTVVACQLTGMGKSSLVRAREALQQRGLISFSVGTPRQTAPSYVIRDTDGDTKRETNDGTKHETNRDTKHETNRGTIIKDIDKDISRGAVSKWTARSHSYVQVFGNEHDSVGNTSNGYWRIADSWILARAIGNEALPAGRL